MFQRDAGRHLNPLRPQRFFAFLAIQKKITQGTQSFSQRTQLGLWYFFAAIGFIEPFERRKKIGRLRWGSNRNKQNFYIKQTKKAAHKQLLDKYLKIIKQLSLAYSFPFLRNKLLRIVFAQASKTQLFFSLQQLLILQFFQYDQLH